jgi:hypothetical protein
MPMPLSAKVIFKYPASSPSVTVAGRPIRKFTGIVHQVDHCRLEQGFAAHHREFFFVLGEQVVAEVDVVVPFCFGQLFNRPQQQFVKPQGSDGYFVVFEVDLGQLKQAVVELAKAVDVFQDRLQDAFVGFRLRFFNKATSIWLVTAVRGVRSSCEALATKLFCRVKGNFQPLRACG